MTKELESLLRDAAELSKGSLTVNVWCGSQEAVDQAKEWMKGKKGFKKVHPVIGQDNED